MSQLCVLLALIVTLTGCYGQSSSDCSKYCHKSCSEYFNQGGDEFSRCVRANVDCDCGLNPTARIVFWVIGTIIIFIIFAICFRACKRMMGTGDSRRYPAVVTTVTTPYPAPYVVGAVPPSRPYSASAVTPAPYPVSGSGLNPRPYSAGVTVSPTSPTPYPYQQQPYNPSGRTGISTAPNTSIMQTGGFIDPPPSYVQTTTTAAATAPPDPDPDQDPPSYAYSTKYRTYK